MRLALSGYLEELRGCVPALVAAVEASASNELLAADVTRASRFAAVALRGFLDDEGNSKIEVATHRAPAGLILDCDSGSLHAALARGSAEEPAARDMLHALFAPPVCNVTTSTHQRLLAT